MKKNWLHFILIILTIAGAACGVQPAQSSAEPTAVASPVAITEDSEAALLLWEGPALFAEDQTECHHLVVTKDYQALIGQCDGEQTEVEFLPNREGGLADMMARFGPFQVDTVQGRLTFNGQGEVASPAWERAIASWAQFTYAELASGRVGAANRTVLAWNLGEQDGQCQMLLVLSHGYATAGLTPCEDGQMEVVASDWVGTADWEEFDAWLYSRAPLYQDNSYLDGRGATELSAEEAVALAEWAEEVYAKLTQTGSFSNPEFAQTLLPEGSMQAAAPPAVCPVPIVDQQLLLSLEDGCCLLYPAEYSLAQPNPDSIEIAKDTVMNHIDARVSIQVEAAAGCSLDEVARQMEVDLDLTSVACANASSIRSYAA